MAETIKGLKLRIKGLMQDMQGMEEMVKDLRKENKELTDTIHLIEGYRSSLIGLTNLNVLRHLEHGGISLPLVVEDLSIILGHSSPSTLSSTGEGEGDEEEEEFRPEDNPFGRQKDFDWSSIE